MLRLIASTIGKNYKTMANWTPFPGRSMASDYKPKICILASAESSPAVLYGMYDVLSSVGVVYPDMVTGVPGEEILDVKIVAALNEPFRCFGNVMVEPHAGIDDITTTDAVIVCDMYTPIDSPPQGSYPQQVEWLKSMHDKQAILTSVCSGSAVLAETGLLNGLAVSGHWAYRHMFRKSYPKVNWCEDSVLSLSGVKDRIITAGGVTAWQGLVLFLIEHFCGRQHAVNTAKVHLLTGHTNGQLPYSVMTKNELHNDAIIKDCQAWIALNFTLPHPVDKMIEYSGLQPRTFARRFKAATGYAPLDYVQELRVDSAKTMLESEIIGIDEISSNVGYEDIASFRRLFKRKTGLTPMDYRKKFAGIIGQSIRGID